MIFREYYFYIPLYGYGNIKILKKIRYWFSNVIFLYSSTFLFFNNFKKFLKLIVVNNGIMYFKMIYLKRIAKVWNSSIYFIFSFTFFQFFSYYITLLYLFTAFFSWPKLYIKPAKLTTNKSVVHNRLKLNCSLIQFFFIFTFFFRKNFFSTQIFNKKYTFF